MTRKYFQLLSEEEMKKIHETSSRRLGNVGMLLTIIGPGDIT